MVALTAPAQDMRRAPKGAAYSIPTPCRAPRSTNLNPWPTMREAADAIALCRARVAELEDGRLRALLAATVGNLTVIGYQNALAQVRAALSGT